MFFWRKLFYCQFCAFENDRGMRYHSVMINRAHADTKSWKRCSDAAAYNYLFIITTLVLAAVAF